MHLAPRLQQSVKLGTGGQPEVFLAETLAMHHVPDVDATFAIADFCFGIARAQPVRSRLQLLLNFLVMCSLILSVFNDVHPYYRVFLMMCTI